MIGSVKQATKATKTTPHYSEAKTHQASDTALSGITISHSASWS